MAPRSLEHKIQLSMFRTGINLAFLSRGILGWFTSRLDCISSFCVVYAFTGILFTVSHCMCGFHYGSANQHKYTFKAYGSSSSSNKYLQSKDECRIPYPLIIHSLIDHSNPNPILHLNPQLYLMYRAGLCGDNDKKSAIIYQRH